jgi:predicted phosphodiesterase
MGSMVGGLGAAGVAGGGGKGTDALVGTPVSIMAPRADGFDVVWGVSGLCLGRVEWQERGGEAGVARADAMGLTPQGDDVLRVRVGGLKPGSSYRIRAITESADGDRREESEWKEVRTLDPAAPGSRFVVWNDTHQNAETIRALAGRSPGGDFLIWNGDVCNDWHEESWLKPTVLDPAGCDITQDRPLVMVWGNHDVRGKWAWRLADFIATPEGRPYRAFRSGPVGVICLHTGEDKPDGHPGFGGRVAFDELRREQAGWLEKVIRSPGIRDAPYRVVFCHIPLRWKSEKNLQSGDYDRGYYDYYSKSSRDAWHDALVKWGAQVVVSGHTHEVAWVPASDEFTYAQITGGGPKLELATGVEGVAAGEGMSLTVRNLQGEKVHRADFKPLA